jgi:hypothetical protein
MSLEELRKSFIVDEDDLRAQLEPMVAKATKHCLVGKNGQVHIKDNKLTAARQVMLVLAARAVASRLEAEIAAEVTVAEISRFTGIPDNQVRARGKDLMKARLVESPARGVYRAMFHKVDAFLDELSDS